MDIQQIMRFRQLVNIPQTYTALRNLDNTILPYIPYLLVAMLASLGLIYLVFGYSYEFFLAIYCIEVVGLTTIMYLTANKGTIWGKMEADCWGHPDEFDRLKCIDASFAQLLQFVLAYAGAVLFLRKAHSTIDEDGAEAAV